MGFAPPLVPMVPFLAGGGCWRPFDGSGCETKSAGCVRSSLLDNLTIATARQKSSAAKKTKRVESCSQKRISIPR